MKFSSVLLLTGLLALWARPQPTTGQRHVVKYGECPRVLGTGAAGRPKYYCSMDQDCPGSERCCPTSYGGRKCMLPIGAKPGFCPRYNSSLITICLAECSSDSGCQGRDKCCGRGCHAHCTKAVPAKRGVCPQKEVLQTFAPCENKCVDDNNCPFNLKCCFTGCGLGCLPPK
ncbi:WAP four-disulfide core domain protein 3-like isoform X2 [Alligator sinensis]|uniref:WAP four-disulfide core domain protein 3-like isoform X2 n=1 Tax=Alligator sinensis TaxID=38654 RepID=A0A3Q0FW76_ALLSI|nr:WAP four-disulfide core domain protein 3-like isoform X2 [Alligator sinensis]